MQNFEGIRDCWFRTLNRNQYLVISELNVTNASQLYFQPRSKNRTSIA